MTTPTTPAELRALIEKATPGPHVSRTTSADVPSGRVAEVAQKGSTAYTLCAELLGDRQAKRDTDAAAALFNLAPALCDLWEAPCFDPSHHACATGDCEHDNANECVRAILATWADEWTERQLALAALRGEGSG